MTFCDVVTIDFPLRETTICESGTANVNLMEKREASPSGVLSLKVTKCTENNGLSTIP